MVLHSAILFSLYLSLALAITTTATARKSFSEAANIVKPGCESKCGNLTVPYPFGIGINSGCSINPSFDVNCDHSSSPPTPFISTNNLEIVGISDSQVWTKNAVSAACYNEIGNITTQNYKEINLTSTTYSFSDTNRLTVVGCDDVAAAGRTRGQDFFGGCVSVCSNSSIITDDVIDGFTGIGCCQTAIPKGLNSFGSDLLSLFNHTRVHGFNPCGYAFLADPERFKFQPSDLSDPNYANRTDQNVPMVLDWAIEGSCDEAKKSGVCREHSDCVDSDTGPGGYRCDCLEGYEGNPYLTLGCTAASEESTAATAGCSDRSCSRFQEAAAAAADGVGRFQERLIRWK